MRKAWLSFLILGLIISALSFSASAEGYVDPRDSRYIPKEVLDKLGYTVIVKAYDCSLLVNFGGSADIEDILLWCNVPERTVYIKKSLNAYRYLQGEMSGFSNNTNYASATLQEFQTREAISAVSPDVVIESVYFFYGSGHYEGNAIYYKTNLGDYVYYRGAWGSPQMLCTAERFFEYKRAEFLGYATGMGGDLGWDLSAYDYRSPNFDPAAPLPSSNKQWIGFAIFAVPLAAVLAVYIIRRRKRMQK